MMMKRLNDVISGQKVSHILPFFWLHGEDHDVLREEIDKIEACGIHEFCVESRPHPDFMGEKWWSDMDMIMSEARKRKMRVWLLDDDKFPTGHAAGGFEKEPQKAKVYLAKRHMDLCGPLTDGAVLVENFLGDDGKLLGIYACKKIDPDGPDISLSDVIDLTAAVCEGVVYLNIPEGYYRLFVLYTTQKGGGRPDYMNLCDRESVRVLLDQVYEPHYKRYRADFGHTFAGFFSDEPELGNVLGYDFNQCLGLHDVHLPWSSELEQQLRARWQRNFGQNLIALWYNTGECTGKLRWEYMDCVSRLVADCFSGQIGAWCKAHGVEYIGHVIEDDNAHARLGCSVAHYFRAERGMHMSGIDVVHLQIIPGFKYCDHQWIASDRDGEFFHFGLAKLGSSLAHLDADKAGRALCEIFGSFGWAEGVWLMKWLTDHMLVRGINTFVPHAFSPKFPDRDCPPHFYARGNNPQYPYFAVLMKYMNRMCHLLSGGRMATAAAVLYHGEAEWSGPADFFQRPIRLLMERQLDCDVVWSDILTEPSATFEKGLLQINGQSYGCLIIPGCQCVAGGVANFIARAHEAGFPVLFVGDYPKQCLSEDISPEDIRRMSSAVSEAALADRVAALCPQPEILVRWVRGSREDLRACAYVHEDGCVYMFFNEHPTASVKAGIQLKGLREKRYDSLVRYDGISNSCCAVQAADGRLDIELQAGAAAVYIAGSADDGELMCDHSLTDLNIPDEVSGENTTVIHGPWTMSLREDGVDTQFKTVRTGVYSNELKSVNAPDGWPRFSGTIRYQGKFFVAEACDNSWIIDFPGLHDGAAIRINGREAGVLIGSPYRINATKLIKVGINTLDIETVNTLTWRIHDGQSTHMQMNPTGMVSAPILYKK